ncbi:protein KAKU4-like isoform X2 [Phragmites australis]|uniref:protein KAKU4-like isoform X2 n=1 Tax=Phragmites australis TaxID=29695 RepID=UPI002D7846B0|nr:protein KAKU4-like isoform X2 [Phragmites australis]
MASLFGTRRRRSPEDDGEGDRSGSGRVQRRRLSPEEDAASPAEGATGTSPGWLSSFVYGARRVFSSVLLFSSPEEAASEEEEDDDGEDANGLSSDENEDIHDNRGAIVPYSESKLAIEQMVMKETFSRDECDKMIELIKSRVKDSMFPDVCEYGTPKEIPSRNAGIGHDFTGAWRSLSRDRNFPELVPFSSMRPGSFSPGSPLQASPELCTAAVTEAKKWLEEKRQGLGLKPEDNGPCTLNTDVFSSGFDSDMGSPVDLAKSYMQSLPPRQSPYLGSQKFNTSPSGGIHFYDDEGKSKYSISSSKVTMKEDYLSNFWANLEESRRARMGSSGGSADASKFRHYDSTSILFENDTSIFSLGTDEKVGEPAQTNNATEPVSGCSIPTTPTEDGNDGIVEPVDPARDNGNAPQEYHAASELHPDKVAEGNNMSPTSVTKDATGHSDVKAPIAEPQIGESHINSASGFRTKDADPPIQTSMNGSTNKTSANGLLDQSNANSGLESSRNDNPSCTNSSSAVPPISKDLTESAADAADVDSVENGTRMNPKKTAKGASEPSYVRRGRKRVARGTRGRGK